MIRERNEAVGYTYGSLVVPAGKRGGIEAYWGGTGTVGTLGVKYPDTYSESGYTKTQYTDITINAHKNEHVINAKTWIRN